MARRTVDELLAEARRHLDRVRPDHLAAEQADGALVVDVRNPQHRRQDGELPGAAVIDRNALERRPDPASPPRLPAPTGHDRRITVSCDEGYSSTLAAAP